MKTVEFLKEKAANGEELEIPIKLVKYIEIKDTDKGVKICIKKKEWQDAIDKKGFYSIASDKNYGAEYVHQKYHLRDASEKGYSEIKTQLGFEVLRTHSTESIENKLFECFVSSILRTEMMQAAKSIGIPTNQMIKEINRIHLFLTQADVYAAIHNESDCQKKFLKTFNVLPEDFDSIAADVNSRESPILQVSLDNCPESSRRRRNRKRHSRRYHLKEDVEDQKVRNPPNRPRHLKIRINLQSQKASQNDQRAVKIKRL